MIVANAIDTARVIPKCHDLPAISILRIALRTVTGSLCWRFLFSGNARPPPIESEPLRGLAIPRGRPCRLCVCHCLEVLVHVGVADLCPPAKGVAFHLVPRQIDGQPVEQ
jgi:hypothetical protein